MCLDDLTLIFLQLRASRDVFRQAWVRDEAGKALELLSAYVGDWVEESIEVQVQLQMFPQDSDEGAVRSFFQAELGV